MNILFVMFLLSYISIWLDRKVFHSVYENRDIY